MRVMLDTNVLVSALVFGGKTKALLEHPFHLTVQEKSKGNYVTSADYRIEEYLKSELTKILPESGILSEESEPERGRFLSLRRSEKSRCGNGGCAGDEV